MSSASSIRAGAAYVELYVNNSRLSRGLKAAQRKLKAFSMSVSSAGRTMLKLSTLAAAPLLLSASAYGKFSDQMAVVRAVTQETGKAFEKMYSQAKELGRTTSFSATQVAEGMTSLGRAGFKAGAIMASIPSVLNLARGTATDLGQSADIAAASLRGFGLEASDMGYVCDTLTATANNSALTLEELGEAMKYVVPFARDAGENLTDTAAAIGVLANNAIKGSMAGTALQRAYKNLSKKNVAAKLKAELDIDTSNAEGNLRPVAAIISEIGLKTKNMGSAKRLNIFDEVFGRGSAAASALSRGGNFTDLQKVLQNVEGVAAKTAKTMDDTLGGSFRMMLSALEGVQIAIGEALDKPLREAMDTVSQVAGVITGFINRNKKLVVMGAKVIAVVGLAGAALVSLGVILTGVSMAVGAVSAIIGGMVTALTMAASVLAALLSPIGLAVAAIAGLGAAILYYTGAGAAALKWLSQKFSELQKFVGKTVKGIGAALIKGDIEQAAKILWLSLEVIYRKGADVLNNIWTTFIQGLLDSWVDFKTGLGVIWLGLQLGWAKVTQFFARSWLEVCDLVFKAWNKVGQGINKIQGWIAEKAGEIFARIYDVDPEQIKADLKQQYAADQQSYDTDYGKLDSDYQQKLKQLQDDAKAEDAGFIGKFVELTSEAEKEKALNAQVAAGELAKSAEALQKAKDEWNAAINEAQQPEEQSINTEDAPQKKQLEQKLKDVAPVMNKTVDKFESRGAFGAAASGLGAGLSGVQDKMAVGIEQISENTAKLVKQNKQNSSLVMGG